jgi:hypothetical protein
MALEGLCSPHSPRQAMRHFATASQALHAAFAAATAACCTACLLLHAVREALPLLLWASVQRMSSKQQEQHAPNQLQHSSNSKSSRRKGVSVRASMSITAACPSAASNGDN